MKKMMIMALVAMTAGAVSAALMQAGYTNGAAFLTPNGETLFYDFGGTSGGADINANTGSSGTAAAFIDGVGNNFWNLGDTVEITGIALRLQGATTNGTFTFTLYQGAGGIGETGAGDLPSIASTTATFNGYQTSGQYWVNFDTPLSFVVGSNTTAVGLGFANTGYMRFKAQDGFPVTRYNTFNGNIPGAANTNGFNMSIAGTVIPEPSTIGLVAAFGGAVLFIRRRFMR